MRNSVMEYRAAVQEEESYYGEMLRRGAQVQQLEQPEEEQQGSP